MTGIVYGFQTSQLKKNYVILAKKLKRLMKKIIEERGNPNGDVNRVGLLAEAKMSKSIYVDT